MAIVGDVPGKDHRGEIDRVFRWVRDCIRYLRDPVGVELVQTPDKTLQYRQGDCDDQVTLLASLLGAIGIRSRFKAVGFMPGSLTHVFLEALDNSNWIALDPIMAVPTGWQPPGTVSEMIEDVR